MISKHILRPSESGMDLKTSAWIYILEAIVVFLGVSVSLWSEDWAADREKEAMHKLDVEQMEVELQKDSLGVSGALWYANSGIQKINRVLAVAEEFHQGGMAYDEYVDSLVSIGIVFLNQTHEIEDFTYQSLLSGVRMYQFPSELAKDVRTYYEHGAKMFGEQNPVVDRKTLRFISEVHPFLSFRFTQMYERDRSIPTLADRRFFFQQPEVMEKYSSLNFVLEVQSLKMTVLAYRSALRYTRKRNESLRAKLKEHAIQEGHTKP